MVFDLLGLGVLFLVIGLVAYALGAKGVGGISIEIGKILLVVFIILFLLAVVFGLAVVG